MKTRIRRHLMLLLALMALGLLNVGQSLAAEYVVFDVGTMGGSKSEAHGINVHGDVAGGYWIPGYSDIKHAFLYREGVMTDLGVGSCTASDAQSFAFRINDSGQIAGSACFLLPSGNTTRAFMYDAGVMTDLGALYSGGTSWGTAINSSGHVAGHAATSEGRVHAMIYKDGVMTDLGSLGSGTRKGSWAFGINDSDQVVGRTDFTDSFYHAFLYNGGVMTDLTPSLGCCSEAEDINNAGQIVGYADFAAGHHAFLYSGGVLTDIGTLGGNSEAWGINNAGEIVGFYYSGSVGRGFLYKNEVMTDLTNLLPAGSGWVLNYPVNINANGRIVGAGTINGQMHGFVIAPAYSGDFAPADCDVDGSDLAALIANQGLLELSLFAQNYGKSTCR
jgi:probable HAF family extracellular repeat protein